MARAASGIFAFAQRRGLRGDLRPRFRSGDSAGEIEPSPSHWARLRRRAEGHAIAPTAERGWQGNVLFTLRCERGDGFDRTTNGARSHAGRALFSHDM